MSDINLPPIDPNQKDTNDLKETPNVEDTKVEAPKPQDSFTPFEELKAEQEKATRGTSKADTSADEIDDEDRRVMESVIDEKSRGIVDKVEGLETDLKVNSFLSDPKNEVYRPFADKIRTYAKSPAARNLTAEALARLAVDPRDMMVRGAEEERKASKEAKETATVGGSARPLEGSDELPNAWTLPDSEFRETIDKAKRGL